MNNETSRESNGRSEPDGVGGLHARLYLTPAEVAERFGVSVKLVRRWIRRGELVAVNVSASPDNVRSRYRISIEAMACFERNRTTDMRRQRPARRRRADYPRHV